MSEERNKYSLTARYAGLAIQWLVMLGLAVWAGIWLDKKVGIKALFVILLPLAALCVSLWQIIREFNNKKK